MGHDYHLASCFMLIFSTLVILYSIEAELPIWKYQKKVLSGLEIISQEK